VGPRGPGLPRPPTGRRFPFRLRDDTGRAGQPGRCRPGRPHPRLGRAHHVLRPPRRRRARTDAGPAGPDVAGRPAGHRRRVVRPRHPDRPPRRGRSRRLRRVGRCRRRPRRRRARAGPRPGRRSGAAFRRAAAGGRGHGAGTGALPAPRAPHGPDLGPGDRGPGRPRLGRGQRARGVARRGGGSAVAPAEGCVAGVRRPVRGRRYVADRSDGAAHGRPRASGRASGRRSGRGTWARFPIPATAAALETAGLSCER
jgi:hypothetical protein